MNSLIIVSVVAAFAVSVSAGSLEPRILGGSNAAVGQFPYQISLQYFNTTTNSFQHFCGGSIIDPTHIATAAHCLANTGNFTLRVVAGANDITKQEANQQISAVAQTTVHPNYTSGGSPGPYDVAVLTLATALNFNSVVNAIALPPRSVNFLDNCVVTGWGSTSGSSYTPSAILQKINAQICPMALCQAAYLELFNDKMTTAVCAKPTFQLFGFGTFVPLPNAGSCRGDSGGPLACTNNGTPFLAGIVSWGLAQCGLTADIYTDVNMFASFINSAVASSGMNATTTTTTTTLAP